MGRHKGSKNGQLLGCGTNAGYQQHRLRKEKACEPCLEANRAYNRSRYKPSKRILKVRALERKRDVVREEKLRRGKCFDCGLVIDERTIVCIDFDHRDPAQKSFTISDYKTRINITELMAEMAKCDAVCRNCHAIRTHEKQHHLFRRTPSATVPTLFD